MLFASLHIVLVYVVIWEINPINAVGQMYTSDANHKYYIEFEQKFNWFESLYECFKLNMTLVEVKTRTKNLELETLIKKHNSNDSKYLWIGGVRHMLLDTNFSWYSSGEQFNYSNWYKPASDSGPAGICVEIVNIFEWKWRGYSCASQNGFICEHTGEKRNVNIFQTSLLQQLQVLIEQNLSFGDNLKAEMLKEDNLKQEFSEQMKQHLEMKNNFEQKLQEEMKEKQKLLDQLKQLQENEQLHKSPENDTKDLPKKELQNSTHPYFNIYFNNLQLN